MMGQKITIYKGTKHQPARRRFVQSIAALSTAGMLTFSQLKAAKKSATNGQSWPPYQQKIVIDALCGGLHDLINAKGAQQQKILTHIQSSGITAINETVTYPGTDFKQATQDVASYLNLISDMKQQLCLIRNSNDILTAKQQQKLGLIMGFQSVEMFEGDIDNIKTFADLGVKIMQLSYNKQSDFGAGCLVSNPQALTQLGIEAISQMNDLNVMIDLSHAAKPTVQQALELSREPIAITHSACNALYQHPRNNDDEDLKSLANKGGVVGIYLMPFLEGGEAEISAEMVIKHIEHAINLCGEDHVGIGSDQGIVPINDTPEYREMIRKEVFRRQQAGISAPGEAPNRPPFIPQLNSEKRMEMIAWHLHQRKYSDAVIDKVLGQNFLRLFNQVVA